MISRFWTRTTWLLTLAAIVSCLIWIATGAASSGWLTLLLLVAAIGAAYPAISEHEDDIGPRVSDAERQSLAEWAGERERENELRRRLALGQMRKRYRRTIDGEDGA